MTRLRVFRCHVLATHLYSGLGHSGPWLILRLGFHTTKRSLWAKVARLACPVWRQGIARQQLNRESAAANPRRGDPRGALGTAPPAAAATLPGFGRVGDGIPPPDAPSPIHR